MKSFTNDNDGISISDFEKLVLGTTFISLIVSSIIYLFKFNSIDTNLVYLISTVGGLFVLRKGLKYNFDAKTKQASAADFDNTEQSAKESW